MQKRNLFIPILLCLTTMQTVEATEDNLSTEQQTTKVVVQNNQEKDGWKQSGGQWYYYQNGQKQTGWFHDEKSGEWYYFQADGIMLQNTLADLDAGRYLFTRSGAMLRGWNDYQGEYYFADQKGHLQSGWLYDEDYDAWYHFDKNGKMEKNKKVDKNGYQSLLSTSGKLVIGWDTYLGDYYFADQEGRLQSGWLYDDNYGNWYHFDKTGKMESAKFIDSNGYKHLVSDSGRLVIGWDTVGNDYYYGDKNGALYSNSWVYDDYYGGWYHFDKSGKMDTNKMIDKNGYRYLITNSGKLAIGWGEYLGDYYYGDASGALQSGWLYDDARGKWYYLDKNGKMLADQIMRKDHHDCLLLPSGELLIGIGNYRGAAYFADKNGYLQTGLVNDGKYTYLVQENHQLFTGWYEEDGYKYYFKPNGVRATSWQYIDGKWYYFGNDGHLKKGWITIPELGIEVFAEDDGTVDISQTKLNQVEKVIEWYESRIGEVEYSMEKRNGPDSYDCSSALYSALWDAGLETKIEWLGNTETLFKEKGHLFSEIDTQEVRRGDVFISGYEGNSLGSGGHTGVAYTDTSIIHCNWGSDGIEITPIKGYAGPTNLPLRWFRIQKYY